MNRNCLTLLTISASLIEYTIFPILTYFKKTELCEINVLYLDIKVRTSSYFSYVLEIVFK